MVGTKLQLVSASTDKLLAQIAKMVERQRVLSNKETDENNGRRHTMLGRTQ